MAEAEKNTVNKKKGNRVSSQVVRTRGYAHVVGKRVNELDGAFEDFECDIDGMFSTPKGVKDKLKREKGDDYIAVQITNHRVTYAMPEEEFFKHAKPTGEDIEVPFSGARNKSGKNVGEVANPGKK